MGEQSHLATGPEICRPRIADKAIYIGLLFVGHFRAKLW